MTKRTIAALCLAVFAAGCGDNSESPASRALEELESKYDELAREQIEQPVRWASEDLENIGDWEYKVVDLSTIAADRLEIELNALGNERWELVWIDVIAGQRVALFKRPAVSWLSRIPLSQLGRMLLGGGEDAQ